MQTSAARFVLVAVAIASSAALAVSARVFNLPDHGALSLMVPDGWTAEMQQPPDRLPPTIALTPQAGEKFVVLVTTVWAIAPETTVPDGATLRAKVAAAAKDAETQSVEGTLALRARASTLWRPIERPSRTSTSTSHKE
jgi:hypothetical protein